MRISNIIIKILNSILPPRFSDSQIEQINALTKKTTREASQLANELEQAERTAEESGEDPFDVWIDEVRGNSHKRGKK